jgi:Mn2+/Fe2+ NRAMP family transporter
LAPAQAARPALWRRVALGGPGIVFLAAAVGPQYLVSNAAVGVAHGYTLLWALGLSILARFVFLEATARYVLATGETLIQGYNRVGRWAVWLLLASILVKRHASNLSQLLLIGLTVNWILPQGLGSNTILWSLLFWTLGFALMYWGRYRAVERLCRPLVLFLGVPLLAVAVLARPEAGQIIRGFLEPSVSGGSGLFNAFFVLLALAGSASGAISNLKYSAFVHEKGWRDAGWLGAQRADLGRTALGLLLVGTLIQAAAAEALGPAAGELKTPEQLVAAFSDALGPNGRVVIAIGLWAAVFTTYLGANTGYSLMVSDIVATLAGREEKRLPGERPAYRLALVWFSLSPLYALWTDWSPVSIVLIASAVQFALMPVTAGLLLLLTTNRERMRELRNHPLTNLALAAMILASLALIGRNVWDWL